MKIVIDLNSPEFREALEKGVAETAQRIASERMQALIDDAFEKRMERLTDAKIDRFLDQAVERRVSNYLDGSSYRNGAPLDKIISNAAVDFLRKKFEASSK